MPKLLSSKTLRRGGSGEFIDLKGAMPQLPPTPTTSTGYTLVTNDKFQTVYRSSLGNIEFSYGELYSNIAGQNIKLIATDTSKIIVAGNVVNTSTNTGALVVEGGIGVWGSIHTGEDIIVNGLTIGQGYQGTNNIVLRGEASPLILGDDNGQNSIAIGYDTLGGLTTSFKSIGIGRHALQSGTNVSRNIAIGDSALQNIGLYQSLPYADITNITLTNPVVVTAPGHDLTSGTYVIIKSVIGTTELNNNYFYVWVDNSTTFKLYADINLNIPVDGTGYTAYVSSGTVELDLVQDDNIALGVNAGQSLLNGQENFFLGTDIAKNLTTGSYNILVGHDVANNMTRGNANISIGGDNLVNGRDNQVNIGSVFYYDGISQTDINSDLATGLGTRAVPGLYSDNIFTATQTNPVQIITYINGLNTGSRIIVENILGMTELNNGIFYTNYLGTNTNNYHVAELYADALLTQPIDGSTFTAYISSGTVFMLQPQGSVTVYGGVGIHGNLIVDDRVDIYAGMWVESLITGTITTATNLEGGVLGSIPYQTAPGETDFIPIGASDTVLTSDGSTATWQALGSITVGGAIDADNAFINSTITETSYYLTLNESIGTYTALISDISLTYVTTTATTSTYFYSGTNVLNVPGSIYSIDGNSDEQNLLYTPRVTISTTPPPNPRVGDFWINSTTGYELQWVDDGGNKFWIQFTSL